MALLSSLELALQNKDIKTKQNKQSFSEHKLQKQTYKASPLQERTEDEEERKKTQNVLFHLVNCEHLASGKRTLSAHCTETLNKCVKNNKKLEISSIF